MRMSKVIPYRKLKVIVVICICVFIVASIWSTYEQNVVWLGKQPSRIISAGHLAEHWAEGFLNFKKEEKSTQEIHCDKITPFQHTSGRISTYDLPNETDYSLGPDKRYKLPEEILGAKVKDDPVTVIVVPFSHTDPGYGRTVEQYYTEMTRSVLNNMVDFLVEHPNMTFQWVETVFLERWFRDINEETKQKVRNLIARGQLEVVLGGWVMPDEAITYYAPVVDQLIEGHQWLLENLGVYPRNAWINDPFGYSSTMPYLWKSSGINNMVFLRIHQAIKHTLMRKHSLDFMWRPYWNSGNKNDILSNLMPYTEYWNSGVCGPNQNICEKFNFLWLGSARAQSAQAVTEQNIVSLATMLQKEYRFTASLYQYKTLIIFIGEDNSFTEKVMWENTYSNYGKLMNYINSKPEWKMNIKFGTMKEYFERIRTEESNGGESSRFPILSGDFFPYSEKDNDYWTGYFTTRPWMKRFTREIEALIRAADKFSVILYNHCLVMSRCENMKVPFTDIMRELRTARREVGIYQHHDGITGTSLPHVVNDYETRLQIALTSVRRALTSSIGLLVSGGTLRDASALSDNIDRPLVRSVSTPKLFKFKNGHLKIVVANPLEKSRTAFVSFYTSNNDIIVKDGISYQISPSDISKFKDKFLVTLLVPLSPFQLKTIELETSNGVGSSEGEKTVSSSGDTREILTIENSFMKVEFFGINGSLKSITDKRGFKTEISNEFLKYQPVKSGAYLFGPKGPAKRITELPRPEVKVTTGRLFSQIKVAYKSGFIQKWTLYNTDDIQRTGLYLTQEITLEIEPNLVESEVILRFKTDIDNKDVFFTDQNGFQLMGRKNDRSRLIESNYYPMTSMAIIEDQKKRLTLHSAQSHGVASLENGWLEVMLDRNMQHDDGKGLGQGAYERVVTLTEFIIQIEYKSTPFDFEEVRYTHASITSTLLNEQLQNKPQVFSAEIQAEKVLGGFEPFKDTKSLSCDMSIVGLRILVTNDLNYNGTSLVLHRRPKHCSYPVPEELSTCSLADEPITILSFSMGLDMQHLSGYVSETSLSHLHTKAKTDLRDDIRPRVNEMRSFLMKTMSP